MVTNIGTKQIQKNLLEKELITTKELGDLYENGFIPFEVLVEPGDPDTDTSDKWKLLVTGIAWKGEWSESQGTCENLSLIHI